MKFKALFFICALITLYIGVEFYKYETYVIPEEKIVLLLDREQIVDELDANKLIGSKFAVQAIDFFNRKLRNKYLKVGEYQFKVGDNVLRKIYARDRYVRKITIPEGLTVKQIANLLSDAYGLVGEIPPLVDCDLMPDTYFYYYADSKQSIIDKMRAEFVKYISKVGADRDAVILASIIERESGIASERPLVSSVFHNRIKLGMPLQSDPTVIYALSDGLGVVERSLKRDDLQIDSPYNTYKNRGLPPTPIACSGRAAIIAAVEPASTAYLFFVAKGGGEPGHNFASDLNQHNAFVNLYRSRLLR